MQFLFCVCCWSGFGDLFVSGHMNNVCRREKHQNFGHKYHSQCAPITAHPKGLTKETCGRIFTEIVVQWSSFCPSGWSVALTAGTISNKFRSKPWFGPG